MTDTPTPTTPIHLDPMERCILDAGWGIATSVTSDGTAFHGRWHVETHSRSHRCCADGHDRADLAAAHVTAQIAEAIARPWTDPRPDTWAAELAASRADA